MELSLAEIELLIECVAVTRMEHGGSRETDAMYDKLREIYARRKEEIERYR